MVRVMFEESTATISKLVEPRPNRAERICVTFAAVELSGFLGVGGGGITSRCSGRRVSRASAPPLNANVSQRLPHRNA